MNNGRSDDESILRELNDAYLAKPRPYGRWLRVAGEVVAQGE